MLPQDASLTASAARSAEPERAPTSVLAYFDPQCPYSHRVLEWLADLGPGRVAVSYRAFSLEQVNRDPSGEDWRIWEQDLDYRHHRGRPDRRSLAAFLAIHAVEEAAGAALADRLRLAISTARHRDGLDISDPAVLDRLATEVGLAQLSLEAALATPGRLDTARRRLEADWWAARYPDRIFGVPTLILDGRAPVYVRLDRTPEADEAPELLDRLVALGRDFPYVLELKKPDRA